MRYTIRGHARRILAAALLVGLAACKGLENPNFNGGDLGALESAPDRASIASAAQGLEIGHRSYQDGELGFVSALGVLGRESYVLDVADPRFVNELLQGPLNAGGFGAGLWDLPYQNIRLANILINAVNAVSSEELTDGEKSATLGFAKTMQALDFLTIVDTRDTNCDGSLGCPIDVGQDVSEGPAPAVSKRQVYDHIQALLDDGLSDLKDAGGAGFPFILASGFSGFDTPATFQKFNRAIKARVDVYMGGEFDDPSFYTDALNNALPESFMDSTASLDLGVYDSYGTGSGDQTNGLFQPSDDPNIRAHPSVIAEADSQSNGQLDDRVLRKTRAITFRTFGNVGSDVGYRMYNSLTAPVPIIRNEELILLKAEANVGLGNLGAARNDINFIRTTSGKLDPVGTFASQQEALDQLLYEKRYSLLFEGGHRWLDLRRYGLLDRVAHGANESVINARYPIPLDEQNARK